MRWIRAVPAMLSCVAVMGIGAGAAQAAWTVGESGNSLSGSETVMLSGTPFALEYPLLGVPVVIEGKAVQCMPEATCSIEGANAGALQLLLTEVAVTPSTCAMPGGTLATYPLRMKAVMGEGAATFLEIAPVSGEVWSEFEMTGAECPLAGNVWTLKGTAYARALETGVLKTDQTLTFNVAEEEAGGSTLHVGRNTRANLNGVVNLELSGADVGEAFGVE